MGPGWCGPVAASGRKVHISGSRTRVAPCQVHARRPLQRGLKGEEQAMPEGTILVVDDEATVRQFVEAVLHREGYCVLEAGDGGEAL